MGELSCIGAMKKKICAIMLILSLSLSPLLTGCTPDNQDQISSPISIGALNGPTGIGMVQLMESPEKFAITTYQSPDEVVGKIITGEVDIAAVPSNLAAVLYNKMDGGVVLLGVNTLGTLFIVENGQSISSPSDLSGKTLIASGKGGSPEFILNQLLLTAGLDPQKDLTITWLLNHSDVASTLMAKEGTIAMLPQPFTTIVTEKNPKVRMAVDLNAAWEKSLKMTLPMGVLIAQKSFIEERPEDLAIFLADYAASVDFVRSDPKSAAALVAKHGIIADAAIAEKAIPGCNIVFIPAKDSKSDLINFYGIISAMDPKSVGGTIPDEAFYYSGTE
jgi:NitT/TauT family transport system substrate-binding protein